MEKEQKTWVDTYVTHSNIIYEVDADVYQNEKLTRKEIDIVEGLCGGKILTPVLDLACGQGRHSIEMAQRGYSSVSALDYSPGFIKIAEQRLEEEGLVGKVKFKVGDARRLPFTRESFKTITMLENSFGYWSDKENEKIITEVARVLEKEGQFILDVSDKDHAVNNLKPEEVFLVRTKLGEVLDLRERSWDEKSKRIKCRKIHVLLPGEAKGSEEETESPEILLNTPYDIRLYGKEELKRLLNKHGFSANIINEKYLSSQSGVRPGLTSSKLWVIAIKE